MNTLLWKLNLLTTAPTMNSECLRCGSQKLMHNMPLQDSYGDMGNVAKPAAVQVHGKPEAWIFKETSTGELSLTICGECGYAELQVNNFRELYEKHVRAQRPKE